MIGRLRVLVKRIACRFLPLIEFCHDCGRTQPLVWKADDALWRSVHGDGGGIYCPECFDARAYRKGIPIIYWTASTEFRSRPEGNSAHRREVGGG